MTLSKQDNYSYWYSNKSVNRVNHAQIHFKQLDFFHILNIEVEVMI